MAASPILLGASDSAVSAVVASPAAIEIAISGLRSQKGQVLICLTAKAKHFPDCRKDESARKISVSAANAQSIRIGNVKPGTYALALVHDENANGKMDLALFMPKEGFGFSRNPRIGMGPPKFRSAQFAIDGENLRQAVKMKYIF